MSLSTFPSQAAQWPTAMAELAPAEGFIVWCFRRWALGLRDNNGAHWSLVWSEFTRQLGARDGKAALAQFAKCMKTLQCHARRRIAYHPPCCPCLGADEAWLFSLVAACQNRQPHLARALAEWMVAHDGAGELLEAGLHLAQIMRHHALTLPQRAGTVVLGMEAEGVAGRAAATLH